MNMINYDIKQFAAKLRRLFVVHLRPGYVKQQQNLRGGQCNQCGKCCVLFVNCPMLTKDGLCRVYGKYRPKVCKIYPIDQKDIDEISSLGGRCGYKFEGCKS
jgi:hypothetical protein